MSYTQRTSTMSNAAQYLLTTILLLALAVVGNAAKQKTLLEIEKPGIDKITQLTAIEHSTILFTIADYMIGYAKEGHFNWITSTDTYHAGNCSWTHPALSHDGLRVAYVTDSVIPKHCRIMIYNIPTATQQKLVETEDEPGEVMWSWDDTEIVLFERGISAVSVKDGVKRAILPIPWKRISDRQFESGVWYLMRWLHNGKDLVVELNTELPTKEPGTYTEQSNLLLVNGGAARLLDVGSQPAVSPLSDRIAYYAPEGIVAINADGTGRTVLSKAPSRMIFFKEDLFGNIVWSSDGNRLFFGTIVSESREDNLYLLDVKSGRHEQFLSHSSIMIRGWH